MTIEQAVSCGYQTVYFTFDCIGDTLLLMTALKYLVNKNSPKILIGTMYKELIKNCNYIDILDDFSEETLCLDLYKKLKSSGLNPVFISSTDFIKNGSSYIPRWGKHHILHDICSKIGVNQTIPLTPFFYFTEQEKKMGRFESSKQIAIVSGGNQKYKALSPTLAQQIVDSLNSKYNFVQIGSPSDSKLDNVRDCRGWNGLRGAAMILNQSDLFIGGIGGLLHLARAVNCRSVIAYSAAEPITLANYICNINVFAPNPKCHSCGERKSLPYKTTCENNFSCISGVKLTDMISAIEVQLSKNQKILEIEYVQVQPDPITGMESFFKRFGSIKEIP